MPWIRVDLGLPRHWKFQQFQTILKVDQATALGHLTALWLYVLEQKEDGILDRWQPNTFAFGAGYTGDAPRFVAALAASSFLDPDPLRIHDWLDYAGHYLTLKYRNRVNGRASLESIAQLHGWSFSGTTFKKTYELPTGTSDGGNKVRQITGILRSEYREDEIRGEELKEKDIVQNQFEDVWKRYPNRVGKKEALRHYNASVKTPEDVTSINAALTNYLRSVAVKRGFVQLGRTWFNNWRDWLDPGSAAFEEPNTKRNGGVRPISESLAESLAQMHKEMGHE